MYHIEFHERIKNAVYSLQTSVLVPEILKFEKCVKYPNEITDDVIRSTQCYIKYINRAIFANFRRRPLKLGRLIILQKTNLSAIKNSVPIASHSFPVPTYLISIEGFSMTSLKFKLENY